MKTKLWRRSARWPAERQRMVAAHAIGGALFVVSQATIGLGFPALKISLFCQPAALLASLILGTPSSDVPGGFLLQHPLIDVQVSAACSGFDFFTLLYAALGGIAAWNAWPVATRRAFSRCACQIAWLLPLSFVIGLGANTSRIVCAVYARLYANLLPGLSAHATHLAVGLFVFVTVLVAACHIAQSLYAKHSIAPANRCS